jgi:hypothetical protein
MLETDVSSYSHSIVDRSTIIFHDQNQSITSSNRIYIIRINTAKITNRMVYCVLTVLAALGCLGLVIAGLNLPLQFAVGDSNCSGNSNSTCTDLHSNAATIPTLSKFDSKLTPSSFVDSTHSLSAGKKEVGPTASPFILPFP